MISYWCKVIGEIIEKYIHEKVVLKGKLIGHQENEIAEGIL